jgi:hypothetical protein
MKIAVGIFFVQIKSYLPKLWVHLHKQLKLMNMHTPRAPSPQCICIHCPLPLSMRHASVHPNLITRLSKCNKMTFWWNRGNISHDIILWNYHDVPMKLHCDFWMSYQGISWLFHVNIIFRTGICTNAIFTWLSLKPEWSRRIANPFYCLH